MNAMHSVSWRRRSESAISVMNERADVGCSMFGGGGGGDGGAFDIGWALGILGVVTISRQGNNGR